MSIRYTLVFALLYSLCFGQQRPLQSLYLFDQLLLNPAYSGMQNQLSATAIYRNQWVNLEGAPKTFSATVHSAFRKNTMGVGLIAANDQIGIHTDASVFGTYAYRIKLNRKYTLSMGLQGGFNNIRSDFNKLSIKNQNDSQLQGVIQNFNPNVGGGLILRHNRYYLGFSVPYLINSRVLEGVSADLTTRHRYYYLMGSMAVDLSEQVRFIPGLQMRFQEKAPYGLDLNGLLIFKRVVGLGSSYRLSQGFTGLFQLTLNENFRLAYAYDFTSATLRTSASGSHEMMINYRFRIPGIHKGSVFPAYW
jgi:type IX secretion system PorP/SprF family membrane protein